MERFYTVEKVAELLTMHPKTVQRYIREGKIKAKKIGKSWRIYEQSLKDYMKLSDMREETPSDIRSKAVVSSVVDLPVRGLDEASDIEKFLVAAMNSKPNELGNTTMHIQYLESENKLRVTLWGSILFMRKIFEVLSFIGE